MHTAHTSAGLDRFKAPTWKEQASESRLFDALDSSIAKDRALANLDSWSDWLAAECMHQTAVCSDDVQFQVRMPGQPFDEGAYQLALDAATVAQLQHVTLTTSCQRRSWLALCELKARYLRAQGLTP